MQTIKLRVHQLFHWEYWPSWMIYLPVFPVLLYYMIRARSFFFFNAANPSIESGGFAMESKKRIYDIIPDQFIPKTIAVFPGTSIIELEKQRTSSNIQFPCICKPDVGLRGLAVAKINSLSELQEYNSKMTLPFLIQEYIPYEEEAGIFYCRLPNEAHGKITGIVYKEFPSLTGDGIHSVEALIAADKRLAFLLHEFRKTHANVFKSILPKGERLNLASFGNHARGARFIDYSVRITDKLTGTIDQLCKQIPGFYFGRLDIRFHSWEELEAGQQFSIIELNGSGSEPTHMYDPRYSIFNAWKIILEHWRILFTISVMNNKKGYSFYSPKEGVSLINEHRMRMQLLQKIHQTI